MGFYLLFLCPSGCPSTSDLNDFKFCLGFFYVKRDKVVRLLIPSLSKESGRTPSTTFQLFCIFRIDE